jgi:hypothetical protein
MYLNVSYLLKLLYSIYIGRETQHNIFFLHDNQSLEFSLSSKSSATFDSAAPREIDLDSTRGNAPGSPQILLIRRLSSLSRRHALVDWKFPLVDGEDSPSSINSVWNTSM